MRVMTTLPELAEPRLATRRLVLRPLAEGDLDDIVFGVGNFNVARYLARVPHPYGRRDAEGFLAFVRHGTADVRRAAALSVRGCLAHECEKSEQNREGRDARRPPGVNRTHRGLLR